MRCVVAACLALAVVLAGCAPQPQVAAQPEAPEVKLPVAPRADRLRVGMSRTMPPIAFREGGKTLGLEADFAAALAAELGRELQIVPVFWPELLIELEAQRIDIVMSGMTITDARQTRAAFCEPYLTVGQMPLVKDKKLAATLTDRSAVCAFNGRVGVEVDSTGQQWVQSNMPQATVTSMRTLDELSTALAADQVDMIVHDSPAVAWAASQNARRGFVAAPVRLTDEHLAWAVNRGNDKLRAQANAALARWRTSGRLEQTLDQWVPADVRGAKAE